MKAGNTAGYYAYGVITFRVPIGHPLKNGNDREKKKLHQTCTCYNNDNEISMYNYRV